MDKYCWDEFYTSNVVVRVCFLTNQNVFHVRNVVTSNVFEVV